jgi:hypothetical protein
MHVDPPVAILETEPNKLGDLFCRLVRDLLHSLGFDSIRVNVSKTGREIDLLGQHRLEKKRFILAECKASADPIGGDDINKFVGALDAERKLIRTREGQDAQVSGYFVSLSGFRGSATEQEAELGNSRVTLLNGVQVVEELVRARIVVSREKAIDIASRIIPKGECISIENAQLLSHNLGLVWALYYRLNGECTSLALVHADGHPLASTIANQILSSDIPITQHLKALKYIAPVTQAPSNQLLNQAKDAYFKYLEASCGEIQLDGLPADEDVGSKRLKLEHLFVPLHVISVAREEQSQAAESAPLKRVLRRKKKTVSKGGKLSVPGGAGSLLSQANDPSVSAVREPVGKVLQTSRRLALLASPGAGKSTLIKRLAVAYAFPGRRKEVLDQLPDVGWFPLLLKCRELGQSIREPILNILLDISARSEMDPELRPHFEYIAVQSLRDGNALLLVDGLDEIANDSERMTFASALRTFLATYPQVSMVVTSREAGFRLVGGALGLECERYRIADLDDSDIRSLVISWHREVANDKASATKAGEETSDSILKNDRIRLLACNPLLLTTLLLVKRWVGQLPTRRSVLYEKAIEVLLMTWNVQGHAPISLDEAIPRLCYIAFAMMKRGVQQVSLTTIKARVLPATVRESAPRVAVFSQCRRTSTARRMSDGRLEASPPWREHPAGSFREVAQIQEGTGADSTGFVVPCRGAVWPAWSEPRVGVAQA